MGSKNSVKKIDGMFPNEPMPTLLEILQEARYHSNGEDDITALDNYYFHIKLVAETNPMPAITHRLRVIGQIARLVQFKQKEFNNSLRIYN